MRNLLALLFLWGPACFGQLALPGAPSLSANPGAMSSASSPTAFSNGSGTANIPSQNLVAHYDASVASSITISTGVSQWNDLTGHGNNLLQASGPAQPTLVSGGVRFTSGNTQYMAASFTLNQPETVYFVGQQITWASGLHIFDGVASNSALVQITSTPTIELSAGSGAAVSSGWALSTSAVIMANFNGASSALRVNRTAAVTGNPGAGNAGGFTLGASHLMISNTDILVFEVLIYNVSHDTPTQNNIIAALEAKWGLPNQ